MSAELDLTPDGVVDPAPAPAGAEGLATWYLSARREMFQRDTEPYAKRNVWASYIDPDGCLRRAVLEITNWQDRAPFSAELKARFQAGHDAETVVMREMRSLGLNIVQQQARFDLKHRARPGVTVLSGKLDGKIRGAKADYPVEVKSSAPWMFDRLRTVEEIRQNKWTKHYPNQITAYLIGENCEEGLLVLTDLMGRVNALPVRLDYELAERLWTFAEHVMDSVQDHRDGGLLPDYTKDAAECRRCPFFGRVCQPPIDAGPGATVFEDGELEAKLDRWSELRPKAREYEALDRQVKSALRASGAEYLVVGDYGVTIKERPVREFTVAARTDKIVEISHVGEPED